MLRIATALVLLPLLWLTVNETSAAVFLSIMLVVTSSALWEFYRMLSSGDDTRPLAWLGFPAAWAVLATFSDALPFQISIGHEGPLVALVIASMVAAMWLRPGPEQMFKAVRSTVFGVVFVAMTLGHLVALREGPHGRELLIMMFVCVILADTMAYYVGKNFGKHRLAPKLSPKKSWEGFFGGLGASVLGAIGVRYLLLPEISVFVAGGVGAALGCAAVLGDLAESMVKRACGVKDSSSLLPGHGGILDRLDSVLFTAPLLYYLRGLFL